MMIQPTSCLECGFLTNREDRSKPEERLDCMFSRASLLMNVSSNVLSIK
jgi:hypothetical protein